MNRKQLNLLIGLVLIVGGLGLFIYNRQTASWNSNDGTVGGKLLPDLPLNDIAQIAITQGATNLHVVKNDDLWRVAQRWDYPADFPKVSELLRKLWELETVQKMAVGPSQLGRLELLPPDNGIGSGTRLELKDKDGKPVRSVMLGKMYLKDGDDSSPMGGGSFPVGRYVMVESSGSEPAPVWVLSDPLSQVETKPDGWLDKTFFKVTKLRSAAITAPNETNSWTIHRETEAGDLMLADLREGEDYDKSKASAVGYLLSSPSFNDVVSPENSNTGFDAPRTARIETFEGFTYSIKVGDKTEDENFPITVSVSADLPAERTAGADEKPENKERLDKEFADNQAKLVEKLNKEKALEKWTYLVSKWTIDALLKDRKDFMAEEKSEDATSAEPPPIPSFGPPDVGLPPPFPGQ